MAENAGKVERDDTAFARSGRIITAVGSIVGGLAAIVSSVEQISRKGPDAFWFVYTLLGHIGALTVQTIAASMLVVFAAESVWTGMFGDKGILIGVICVGIVELFLVASGVQDLKPYFFYPWLPPLTGFVVVACAVYFFYPRTRSA